MKRLFFGAFAILLCTPCIVVTAAPKRMPDGSFFDAAYYGSCYPDVVAAVGTSESALYNHYMTHGKYEGRKPYASPDAAVRTDNEADPDKVIEDVNAIRIRAGLTGLAEDTELDELALVRANDMIENNYFSHEKNGELMMVSVVENSGYKATEIGENLGRSTAQTSDDAIQGIVNAWETSQVHYSNINDNTYTRTGVSIIKSEKDRQWYVVQMFSD